MTIIIKNKGVEKKLKDLQASLEKQVGRKVSAPKAIDFAVSNDLPRNIKEGYAKKKPRNKKDYLLRF